MSAAWDSNLRLMQECDKAIEQCAWCREFGHVWMDCELYRMTIKPPRRDWSWTFWPTFVCLMTGFVAGFCLKALLVSL